jgi:hypothetical protein
MAHLSASCRRFRALNREVSDYTSVIGKAFLTSRMLVTDRRRLLARPGPIIPRMART